SMSVPMSNQASDQGRSAIAQRSSAPSRPQPFGTALLGVVLSATVAAVCTAEAPAQSIRVVAPLPGASESQALAVSANGLMVAGNSDPFGRGPGQGLRWTAAGGSANVGLLAGSSNMWAQSISGDGTTIVGLAFSAIPGPIKAYRARNGI